MNEIIIEEISKNLNITKKQVTTVLTLLQEGNTVPFIARYRKEATNALDEEVIRSIEETYLYQENLLKRKESILKLIDEKGLLTDELQQEIMKCTKLIEVEDLYRPYKEKKKTKATEAIALGLEPLAKAILTFPKNGTLDLLAKPYLTDKVPTMEKALEHAKNIIAEIISDNANYRKEIRRYTFYKGFLASKLKKNAKDELKTYEMYYDYEEMIKNIKPHRILAMNRGEDEKILTINIKVDHDYNLNYLIKEVIGNKTSSVNDLIIEAINDSYKRLIFPSIEREIRAELKETGEEAAIDNFSKNVEKLLLTPPIKEKVVLGFDPAYRTGCKLAVLDVTGKPLEIAVIYPNAPHNDTINSRKKVLELIDKYKIDIVAIGNGTASRESEAFIADTLKEANRHVEYIIVSEAGASVYSASKLAIQEFPDLTVEKRSAISIGRRLQDALAELVKIDPKSIGVGLYQHDVTPKKLDNSLDFVVTKTVNQVGVNINTASASLLNYVSGLSKKAIDNILTYRNQFGKISSRSEYQKIKGITPKIFEQSVGFIRVLDGTNPLDKTSIHPERYNEVLKLLTKLGFTVNDLGKDELITKLKELDLNQEAIELNIDIYTLTDIVESLIKPGRDPRDMMPKPLLKSDILQIEDLHVGDKLQGTVRNVVDFGVFIDIGLHNDGLAHISKLTDHYIKHPSDVCSVGDIVDCYVIGIDLPKQKVSLSLLPNKA